MKEKFRVLLIAVFALLVAMTIAPQEISSAEYRYHMASGGRAEDKWDEYYSALPDEVKAELSGLADPGGNGIDESVREVSEKASLGYWLSAALKYLTGSLSDVVMFISPIISLMIFTASGQILLSGKASTGLDRVFVMYMSLVSALILYNKTAMLVNSAAAFLDRLCSIMNLMTPVMEVVYLSSGELTSGSVTIQAMSLFITTAGNFTGRLLGPMTNLLFTLSSVSMVCTEAKLSCVTTSLRKLIMRLIQIFAIFFAFVLGAQSILARSADSLTLRTARFAISSFVPIAGGTIAEALSTLRDGMGLIRSTAGIGGIIVIALLLLPELVSMMVYKGTLGITCSAAEILKLDGFLGIVSEVKGIVELVIAVMLFTSLLFVIMLIIFVKSQVM